MTTRHVYGFGSQHSYYRDLIAQETGAPDNGYRARLAQHAEDMLSTDEARSVRAIMQTRERGTDEVRALSSASSSAGVFVTPDYIVSEADWSHSYPASAVGQVTPVDDPGYGLTIGVPLLSAVTTVSPQSTPVPNATTAQEGAVSGELTGVADTSPTGLYATGPVVTLAGEVALSMQVHDRGGPSPYTLDRTIQLALHEALRAEVDNYLLTSMVAAGGTTTSAGSFTASNFLQDCANAQAAVATGANVKLPATHVFGQPTLVQWLLAQSDPQGRPLCLPHPGGIVPTGVRVQGPQGVSPGYTGYTLLGSQVFTDGNITNTTTTESPLVFCNAGEVFLLQSEPAMRVVTDWEGSSTLTVLLQLYSYVGVIVRHGAAVNSLEGAYLLSSPSFA